MSVISVLLRLEMTTASMSWLLSPVRFGEISEMFMLREGASGFHQKFGLCEVEVGIMWHETI